MADEPLSPKIQLDHLARLADDRWREYDHKSKAEWKLSFGIWAALLAATAILITLAGDTDSLPPAWLVPCSILFGGSAVLIHGLFLWRIHTTLAILRKEMKAILNRRRAFLNLPTEPQGDDAMTEGQAFEDRTGSVSKYIQILMSALAAALFIVTAIMLSDVPIGTTSASALARTPALYVKLR